MSAHDVLVIGANGQLARALEQAAGIRANSELRIATIGRPSLDVTKVETLAVALDSYQPALVVNCAAYTDVNKAESEEGRAFEINAEGAAAVAKKCHAADVPMIQISTDFVFSGALGRPYVESDEVGPINAYGASKLEGEIRVAAVCQKHIILRTSWIHSPWGNNFVKTMLRLAGEREDVQVVADQLGCPTFAPHLAAAVLEITRQVLSGTTEEQDWGVYHAAGIGEATWCDFAKRIFNESARLGGPTARVVPIATEEYETPAQRPVNSRLDCTKLKARFGVTLPHWKDGVGECVADLLSS